MEMTPKLKQAVKEYKSGKAESFDTLYKESEKYIYTCIYKVMSGNNNAVDITSEIMQNTYLQIFLNISQLENEDRFLSWAGTIATRECFAYIKKNKKYVLLNEDDDTFENLSDSDDIIPEEVMQSKEKRRLVREIIDTQLNEVQKICIYEFYYNQKKQTEIADIYGIPVNTVKTHLYRANAKIKEGVLHLEKKDGIRLHSFAPFFVLLFNEEVLAATVPAEVGTGVMSTVADASVKAAEAGASASGATTTSTVSTAGTTSSVTTTTVASKVGVLGKIAAASVKTKIIMAVATVSVVGTVGGGVMVASQNGLFGSTPSVNEQQEAGDNQETDENQLATETEEVTEVVEETEAGPTIVEVVELSGKNISGTETRYENGTSDYEIYYFDSDINKTIHYRLTGVESYFVPKDWGGYCRPIKLNRDENDNVVNSLCLYIAIMTDDETFSWASKPDSFYMQESQVVSEIEDYSKFRRVETEKDYRVYSAGTRDEFGGVENCKFYNVLIDDYATGRSFKIMLRGTPDYEYEQLLDILNSIEIVEIID